MSLLCAESRLINHVASCRSLSGYPAMKLLYICSSQFSGSTLTSFLLNNHSSIATIGHTTGWNYSDDEDFRCSCGEKLEDCPLFRFIRKTFRDEGLPYDPKNFGTAFQLASNARLNQLLTGPLPIFKNSAIEHLRDATVRMFPVFRRRLDVQLRTNFVLMNAVSQFLDAEIYLDNSHSPYRLRRFAKDSNFDVFPVHLIRDPRGVALSMMTNSGLTASQAIENWRRHQISIMRITTEIGSPLVVFYESLCSHTDQELGRLHEYARIRKEPFGGDFKDKEHHILGNRMRLTPGTIRLDERWRRDLGAADRRIIENDLRGFEKGNQSHPLVPVIHRYLAVD